MATRHQWIEADDYVYGFFFLTVPPSTIAPFGGNLLGRLSRKAKVETDWECFLQFRLYSGDSVDPYDGKDSKTNYEMTFKGTEEEAVANLQKSAKTIYAVTFAIILNDPEAEHIPSLEWTVLKKVGKEAVDALLANPPHWLHTREIPKPNT